MNRFGRRHLSGYNLFYREVYSKLRDPLFHTTTQMVANEWSKLDIEKKKYYNELASKIPKKLPKLEKKNSKGSAYVAFLKHRTLESRNEGRNAELSRMQKEWKLMSYEDKSKFGKVKNSDLNPNPNTTGLVPYRNFVKLNFHKYHELGKPSGTFKKLGQLWKLLPLNEKNFYAKTLEESA
eukprot:NODE_706_length_4978_cov_0.203730.p3 type:complete len:180 gc:universal NODE_706_length_4978_cov_0.203730:4476-3937(-)